MAFSEPTDSDLVSLLQCPYQAQDGYNLVRRSTMGLAQLFTEISAAKSFGGSVSQFSSNNSDSTGRLNIGASNPIILKRYKLHEIIGEGTFCQIYKATDIYTGKHVAIKILRIGYHILGIREVIFLRYFNSNESRGSQHFLQVLGTFRFQAHFCIVLDLYCSTLLSLLCTPDLRSCVVNGNTIAKGSSNMDRSSNTVHQPRVVRHRLPKGSGSSSGLNGLMRVENGHDSGQRVLNMKKLSKIAASLSIALCILRKEGTIHADIKPENCFVRPKCDSSSSSSFPSSSSRSVSGSQNPSPSPSTPTSTPTPCSILVSDSLNDLYEDFDLHLGDFGNSIHASDVSKYYTDFDLQTLPYRAPEVLLGVPFGHQIDVWSLGILLIELCIGKPLFHARTRQELYDSMCEFLTAPPRVRFAGGMYSELQTNSNSIKLKSFDFGLEDSSPLISSNLQNSKINFAEHLSNVKKLLEKYVDDVPSNLIHFLSGLVHPDPDYRLTAVDAVRHPFLSGGLNVPLCMIGVTGLRPSRAGAAAVGLKTLRTISAKCEKVRQMDAIRVRALRTSCCEEQSTSKGMFSQPFNAEYPNRVVYDENKDSSISSEIKVEYKHDVALDATKYHRAVKENGFHSSDVLSGTPSLPSCNNTISSGGSKELAGSKRPVPFSILSKPIQPSSDSWCATAKSTASTQSMASSSSQGATAEARRSALEGYGSYTMKPDPHVKSVMTESPKIETETDITTGARISNFLVTHNRHDGEPSVLSFKRVRHAGNFYLED